MNGKQVRKLLEEHSWVLDRIEGSHHIFRKTGYIDVSVPIHGKKELGRGLQNKILKDAGLFDTWKERRK